MKLKAILTAILAVLMLSAAGCAKEEGPMEKMGKSLDKAAHDVEEAAEEAAEEVKEAAEDDG